MWTNTQSDFAASLLDPEREPPAPVHGFNVYRNNVAVSLKAALEETFPVVKSLVGDDFFNAMSDVFWRNSPPTSPILSEWGETFPAFIQSFEPAQTLPFLADIAQLEWAWLQAYHSADVAPVSIDILSQLSEEDLAETYLELHPSITLVSSAWPVVAIWQAHQTDTGHIDLQDLPERGENALIIRPRLDVFVHSIEDVHGAFIKASLSKQSISQTLETISAAGDATSALVSLFQTGCFVALQPSKN